MFASASAHIFAQAATIFDGKISNFESHRLLFAKAFGSLPPVSSHRASRLGLAPLFQQAASCLRGSRRKRLCAEIPPQRFERVSVMRVRISPMTLLRRKSSGCEEFLPNAVHDNFNERVCGGYGVQYGAQP